MRKFLLLAAAAAMIPAMATGQDKGNGKAGNAAKHVSKGNAANEG